MKPYLELLPLIFLVVQTNSKAFAHYLKPYEADILNPLPPLQFPGQHTAGEVSGLNQKLSDVEEQIKAIQSAKSTMGAVTGALGAIPILGNALGPATDMLVNHLESAAGLSDLKTDLKIKLGVQEAFVKHKVSDFKTDVKVLKRRLEELFGSDTTDETKRHSVIPALQKSEKILELFADEHYLLWELKLIFFPHLISFATLYAMAATAAGKLIPSKEPTLKRDMDLLQETVLKYYMKVKPERLSRFTITNRQVSRTNKSPRFEKLEDMAEYCPKMQILKEKPSSPIQSCVQGGFNHTNSGTRHFWKKAQSTFYYADDPPERVPEWFRDTVTNQIFCGWEGCWNNLHEYYGNEIDQLTTSALKMIPYIEPPSQLPQAPKKVANCLRDSYGRLGYKPTDLKVTDKSVYDTYGCFKNHCWARCALGWCYTMGKNEDYAKCEVNGDCCPEWKCRGACTV